MGMSSLRGERKRAAKRRGATKGGASALRTLGFDVAGLILALVLGPMLEKTFRQSLIMSQGDLLIFVQRPISGVLLTAVVAIVLGPLLVRAARGLRRG